MNRTLMLALCGVAVLTIGGWASAQQADQPDAQAAAASEEPLGPCGRPLSECDGCMMMGNGEGVGAALAAKTEVSEPDRKDAKPDKDPVDKKRPDGPGDKKAQAAGADREGGEAGMGAIRVGKPPVPGGARLEGGELRVFIGGDGARGEAVRVGPGGDKVLIIREPAEGREGKEPAPRKEPERRVEQGAKIGFLGVAPAPLPPALADQLGLEDGRGVLVEGVGPGSPAARAGIAQYDVITLIDDQIIYSVEQLHKLIAARKPGSGVRVEFVHRARKQSAKVELAGAPRPEMAEGGMMGQMPPGHPGGPTWQMMPGQPAMPGAPGQPSPGGWMQGGQPNVFQFKVPELPELKERLEQAEREKREMQQRPEREKQAYQQDIERLRQQKEHLEGQIARLEQFMAQMQARATDGGPRPEPGREGVRRPEPGREGGERRENPERREGGPVPPPAAPGMRMWTGQEALSVLDGDKAFRAGLGGEAWDKIGKALRELDGTKLRGRGIVEVLAKFKDGMNERSWRRVMEIFAPNPMPPMPAAGDRPRSEGPRPENPRREEARRDEPNREEPKRDGPRPEARGEQRQTQVQVGEGGKGRTVSTVSVASANYRAKLENRTGEPPLLSLYDASGKAIFEKLTPEAAEKRMGGLEEEARKLLAQLRPQVKAPPAREREEDDD